MSCDVFKMSVWPHVCLYTTHVHRFNEFLKRNSLELKIVMFVTYYVSTGNHTPRSSVKARSALNLHHPYSPCILLLNFILSIRVTVLSKVTASEIREGIRMDTVKYLPNRAHPH